MAEQNEVEESTTEQDSPSVEQNQTEEESIETAEKPEQTPIGETEVEEPAGDKNWKAVREELDQLKRENKALKGEGNSAMEGIKDGSVVAPLITPQDQISLQMEEFKAQQSFPELDPDSDKYNKLFDIAVAGQYRAELDRYARGVMTGAYRPLPSAAKIARELKREWDTAFSKKGSEIKNEVLQQAKKSVEQKSATLEAEGRSDKRKLTAEDVENLKEASRRGDDRALAERLRRSGL
jgi:hypothetical protein